MGAECDDGAPTATACGMRPALDVDGVSKIASFFTAQQSRTRSVWHTAQRKNKTERDCAVRDDSLFGVAYFTPRAIFVFF